MTNAQCQTCGASLPSPNTKCLTCETDLPRAITDPNPTRDYDKQKWAALLEYDDEVADAANEVRPLGQRWLDELAWAYLALNDKDVLPTIVFKIVNQARQELDANSPTRKASEDTPGGLNAFSRSAQAPSSNPDGNLITIGTIVGWAWTIWAVTIAITIRHDQPSLLPSLFLVLSGVAACPLTYRALRSITELSISTWVKAVAAVLLTVVAIESTTATQTPQTRVSEERRTIEQKNNTVHDDLEKLAQFHKKIVATNHRLEAGDMELQNAFKAAGADLDMVNLYQAGVASERSLGEIATDQSLIKAPYLENQQAKQNARAALDAQVAATKVRLERAEAIKTLAERGNILPSAVTEIEESADAILKMNIRQLAATIKAYGALGVDVSQIDGANGGFRPKNVTRSSTSR